MISKNIDQKVCPCDSCHAPKIIKDTVACNASRLVNTAETLMRDLAAGFGCHYSPKYQCNAEIYYDFDENWRTNDERSD